MDMLSGTVIKCPLSLTALIMNLMQSMFDVNDMSGRGNHSEVSLSFVVKPYVSRNMDAGNLNRVKKQGVM